MLDDDHLGFADLASPGAVGNLRRHPGIQPNVVDAVAWKDFRFKGRAVVYGGGERFEQLVGAYVSGRAPSSGHRSGPTTSS